MLCGHRHGEARRVDVYDGNIVHTLLADYQERVDGGDGWLRILEFFPDMDAISVTTYSPNLGFFETDSDSHFELSYEMSSGNSSSTTSNNGDGGGGGFG